MHKYKLFLLTACCLGLAISPARGQRANLHAALGPTNAPLGSIARLRVPEGFKLYDGESTRLLLKTSGEPVSGGEVGFLVSDHESWSVVFEFSEIGYVKDAEKEKLNPDEILDSIKRGTMEQNKVRVSMGNAPMEIVGWEIPPRYDPVTHNLEWAIRATSEGHPILNYNTRVLGRRGVMEVVLICEPAALPVTMPAFTNLMAGYSYQTDQSYAEYRSGDKVSQYGLAALVLGGAAVGAAKLGLFAWLAVFFKKAGKAIIVGFVAVIAYFRKLIGRLFGKKDDSSST